MAPHVSVIIPSALRSAPQGGLWLERALASVWAQTLPCREVIVGLDPGMELPLHVYPRTVTHSVRPGCGVIKGHQAATNEAVMQARSPLLAFLEDDDTWEPDHLEQMVRALERTGADIVTASQVLVNVEGRTLDDFHFPTMSSWLVTRLAWLCLVGRLDTRWQIHHDNEWLGRAAHRTQGMYRESEPPDAPPTKRPRRVHLCQVGADLAHPWLAQVAQRATVESCLPHLTVRRTIHEGSILAQASVAGAKAQRSALEYAALYVLYGGIPF